MRRNADHVVPVVFVVIRGKLLKTWSFICAFLGSTAATPGLQFFPFLRCLRASVVGFAKLHHYPAGTGESAQFGVCHPKFARRGTPVHNLTNWLIKCVPCPRWEGPVRGENRKRRGPLSSKLRCRSLPTKES